MTKTLIKIGALSVDSADYLVPINRTFRDAWTFGGNPEAGVISIDLEKAKDIWRDKIRAGRKELLEKLDAEFMKALETNADTSSIVAHKQLLRDAPADPRIAAATSVEELMEVQFEGVNM